MYKRFTILSIAFLVLFSGKSSAQLNPGARQIALANSSVAQDNDVFALFNNPAGLSFSSNNQLGVFYSPAPFGLSELANGFSGYKHNFQFGTVAAGYMTYGFELYRENMFTIAYSNFIDKKFSVGAAINYHTLSIERYGNDNSISFNIGGIASIQKNLRLGFLFENLSRSSFGEEANQIPVVYNSGLSYDISKDITINAAVEKELDFDPSMKFGMEYKLIENFELRLGYKNEPDTFAAGVGINYSIFNLDYAFYSHQYLGLTHQAGIIFSFENND
ncbi:MAG: hypothetical protein PVH88_15285 [Ignavibacteria bacterium]|jgi:hypothetical protein